MYVGISIENIIPPRVSEMNPLISPFLSFGIESDLCVLCAVNPKNSALRKAESAITIDCPNQANLHASAHFA